MIEAVRYLVDKAIDRWSAGQPETEDPEQVGAATLDPPNPLRRRGLVITATLALLAEGGGAVALAARGTSDGTQADQPGYDQGVYSSVVSRTIIAV